jgi:broad specificity phosphatase PhoE
MIQDQLQNCERCVTPTEQNTNSLTINVTHMHRTLVVVRHGERIDEVNPQEWTAICRQKYSHSSSQMYYRTNDPPLTTAGISQAQEVAKTLKSQLGDEHQLQCIFSSKLIRAIQTAHQIALELSLPIVLSTGFARTAQAVGDDDPFDFLSLEEIQTYCPGVTFIDADANEISDDNTSLLDSIVIPSRKWHQSIEFIAEKYPLSILVAHRESIRNLLGRRYSTPYCCYGIFKFHEDNVSCGDAKFDRLVTMKGEHVINDLPPGPRRR